MSIKPIAERISQRLSWPDLDLDDLRQLIRFAKDEDLQGWGLARKPAHGGDVTSQSIQSGSSIAHATLAAREELVVAGLPLVQEILSTYGDGATFTPAVSDGTLCRPGQTLGQFTGPARLILEAERVMLNFLQRLSGVASTTRTYVDAMGSTSTRLLDTRKTTPGFRVLEKYAVACGGGFNHRIGLFDRVMLKDNHLAADQAGQGEALTRLVNATRTKWPDMVIEVEVDRLDQIPPALDAGVDIFLLDNFSGTALSEAIRIIGDNAATEASGGITLNSLPELASLGLDFISTGATVHQSTWKDIGLDWTGDKS
jgi:nicotinate-nucleotide pyrophosphorylase (carboxylating)